VLRPPQEPKDPQTDKLVAVHAPEDDLMWGDDEGPLVFCTNLLRDADQ